MPCLGDGPTRSNPVHIPRAAERCVPKGRGRQPGEGVILHGTGPVLSSSHDLSSKKAIEKRTRWPIEHETFRINGEPSKALRSVTAGVSLLLPEHPAVVRSAKDTIAEARGIVGAWDHAHVDLRPHCWLGNVEFADVVGIRPAICGVEYFGHP
jgi:enoyl-CoA hydratase